MNSKAIAAMMAVIMAVIGFAVVSADGTNAAVNKDISVAVDETDATTYVGINEANYMNYNYTLTWKMKIGDGSYSDVAIFSRDYRVADTVYVSDTALDDSSGDSDKFTVTISADDNIGVYNFAITGKAITSEITIHFKPVITIYIDGTDGKTIDNYEENSLGITVFGASGNAIEVTFLHDLSVGRYVNEEITIPTGMILSDYDWYAVGLPEGLTMSADGHISGIPTKETSEGASFKVYATAKSDGQILSDNNVPITVSSRSAEGITGFKYVVGVDADNAKYDSDKVYVFSANETIIVKITSNGTTAIDDAKVRIISESGVQEHNSGTDGVYTIRGESSTDASGTGAYQVQITYNGETELFTVYVVGQGADLDANIFIVGA